MNEYYMEYYFGDQSNLKKKTFQKPDYFAIVIDGKYLWEGIKKKDKPGYNYKTSKVDATFSKEGLISTDEQTFFRTLGEKGELIRNLVSAYMLYLRKLRINTNAA